MIKIDEKKNCCGCTACANICTKKCISMKSDSEGFLYPIVDVSRCTNCGFCEMACPILNKHEEKEFVQKAYLIQHKNEEIRNDSSAGGAFTVIATWVINKKGVVFGAAYDDNFQVFHTFVDKVCDLERFRNSKYVQSKLDTVFEEVKRFLIQDRWVCFSGTPCQVEGLYTYLGKEYEKLVLVDVVCHGIPSPLIWNKYLNYQGIGEKAISNIRFRDKFYGYKYSTMSLIQDNKNIYHAGSEKDPMLRAFFDDICDRPACYECQFKKRYRISDFTIWDCFSVYAFDKQMDDDKGTTRMLIHTSKGNKIFDDLKQFVIYHETLSDRLVYGVKEMFESVLPNNKREPFFEDAHCLSGKELFEKYYPVNLKVNCLHTIRIVLLKTGTYSFAKKILNKLHGR